ncbi:hypothetical protein GGR88_000404 [Sphingomonas jejuensis]|uniref:Uncharacterized protein n=1 Tax=Sphingomonas jejuensis TaxID=904715 RepID=A0ABX0XJK9_9SPHN|nr:hypothetical protein [Sphingomonas jejuensis]NJC32930.1 hypothetical protein [Sphingomonas jejuensis]
MMIFALIGLAVAAPATPVAAETAEPGTDIVVTARPFRGEKVPDEALATMRGGFRLPSGIDVSLAVQSETSVDGLLLLRSVYRIDDGAPKLALFAPAPGQTVRTQPVEANGASAGGLAVSFDRSSGVVFVPSGTTRPAVSVSSGASPAAAAPDGLAPIDIAPGGSVDTNGGTVRLVDAGGQIQARLDGMEIDVGHVFGQGFGTIIANSGNDRTIDTVTTISLDLTGTTPFNLGSAAMRIDGLATDAVRGMIR